MLPSLAPLAAVVLAALTGCHPASPPAPPPDLDDATIQADGPLRAEGSRPSDPIATVAIAEEAPAKVCEDDRRIRACRVTPGVVAHQISLALARDTLAVAAAASGNSWVRSDAGAPPRSDRVSLILHDRALQPIGEASIAFDRSIHGVAITASADGWLLAAAGDRTIELVPLDPRGRELGPRGRVDGGVPQWLQRDRGGPLLIFVRTGKLGPDLLAGPVVGVDLVRASTIFENTVEPNFGGEIALPGGEAMVARRTATGVSVARLAADGGRQSLHSDFGGSTEYPILAACADGPRLVWSEFGGPVEVRWARLDGDGARVAGPVRLSGTPDHFNEAPSVCDGDDTLVALTGYTGGTGLSNSIDLVRVDGEGQRRGKPIRVAAGSIFDPELVADDDALFLAWIALGERPRVALARVDRAAVGRSKALIRAR